VPTAAPQSFVGWEKALCEHFFASRDGDVSPICSLEVTPSTLAEACGGDPVEQSDEALQAFRSIFNTVDVCDALEHGHYQKLDGVQLPGCISYLSLTLLVDSLIDESIERLGAFRPKLASFLGIERSFSNLTGVADMWRDLQTWLKRESADGKPYRPLLLPSHPPSWTHIGYTLRLSFPSRRDKGLMQHFIDDHRGLLADPRAFLEAFRNIAAGNQASFGMSVAFEEFHHDYLDGRRALGEHRFWLLVQAIAKGTPSSLRPTELSIEMSKDQDEAWVFLITIASSKEVTRNHLDNLAAAVSAAENADAHQFANSIGKGVILFRQIGHARWVAAANLSECVGRIMIGVTPELATRIGNRLGRMDRSGAWRMTQEPVFVAVADEVLTRLGIFTEGSRIITVRVFDGVRTGQFWLGRKPFLPRVAADGSDIQVEAEDGSAQVRCTELEGAPGIYRLEATGTIDGRFVLSPMVGKSGTPVWSRRLSFAADALVHETCDIGVSGSRLRDWKDVDQARPAAPEFSPAWERKKGETDDLIEAIYAGGESGWNEFEIVGLIRDLHGEIVNPWDLLRSLQEATLIQPVLRRQWKGRNWSLVPPGLVKLQGPDGVVIIARGCLGARLSEEFCRAVRGVGGVPWRRSGATPLAPPMIGCVGAEIEALSARLDWPSVPALMPGKRKLAFDTTLRRTDRYHAASCWNWRDGRFVTPVSSQTKVSLTRWAHSGDRDHDIYVVSSGNQIWHLLSRTSAIVLAHSLAAKPLFRAEDGLLVRICSEGALPDALASASRLRTLVNSGPDGRSYIYRMPTSELGGIVRIVPNIVESFKDSLGEYNLNAVSSAIHSGGRIKLTWTKGELSTTRSSS
jgi:hypothetical protein